MKRDYVKPEVLVFVLTEFMQGEVITGGSDSNEFDAKEQQIDDVDMLDWDWDKSDDVLEKKKSVWDEQ